MPLAQPRARKGNHARARIQTIDLRLGISPNEFGEETSVAFADNQDAVRRLDFAQKREPRLLELVAKNEPFERAIKRRDPVEAHRNEKRQREQRREQNKVGQGGAMIAREQLCQIQPNEEERAGREAKPERKREAPEEGAGKSTTRARP